MDRSTWDCAEFRVCGALVGLFWVAKLAIYCEIRSSRSHHLSSGAKIPVMGWSMGWCICSCRVRLFVLLSLFQGPLCFAAPEGAQQLTVLSGSAFRVEVMRRARLQKGRVIQGRLLEPIYAENRLLIPSGALLEGTISAVLPAAHGKRVDAKFHGDFTPLNEPVIQWTVLSRNDGSQYPLQAESSSAAGITLYFRSGHTHQSLVRRGWTVLMGRKDSAMSTVKSPHKWERLQKYFWSQLPYHPQYIEEGTQYEMALTRDLQLPDEQSDAQADAQTEIDAQKPLEQMVSVHSRLRTDLDSANAKAGDPVEAIVTQPVFDANNELIIPQNSILHGKVLQAAAAGRRGRNGTLRFTFNEVTFPSGFQQDVHATPTAIEASPETKLSIDQEGGVTQETNRGIAAPLVMGLLSASAFSDDDGGLGKAAISSNGFALVGRFVAIGIGSRYVSGSIGALGTGRIIYKRFLAHGKDTHFSNDTEVMLEMSPARAHQMAPLH